MKRGLVLSSKLKVCVPRFSIVNCILIDIDIVATFLDPEGGSPNATLVVLLVLGISSPGS